MYQLLPSNLMDAGAMEEWLTYQAARGYQFRRAGGYFAAFDRCPPARCRYRCAAMDPKRTYMDQERQELYEELGWTYVSDLAGMWHIFRCDDPAVPELDTDPVVRGLAFRRVCRRQRRIQAVGLAALVLALLWLVRMMAAAPTPTGWLLTNLPMLVFVVMLLPLFLTESAVQAAYSRRTRRQLEAGIPEDHTGPWRRYRLHARVLFAVQMVYLLVLLLPICQALTSRDLTLEAAAEQVSYVSAEMLDPDLFPGDRLWGRADLNWEVFIPKRYDIWETYPDCRAETWLDQAQTPALAELVYRSRAEAFLYRYADVRRTEVTDSRFDQAEVLEAGEVRLFLACRGRAAVALETDINADLTGYTDQLTACLAPFA